MRLIYVDEAGTSAPEPVTVVVGLIVDPDRHWLAANSAISRLLQKVPTSIREGFISHAKSILNGRKYQDEWSLQSRRQFLLEMMSIPRRFGIPIAMAKVNREVDGCEGVGPLRKEEFQHAMAFEMCIEQADDYMRKYSASNEIAIVLAEDVPNIRNVIKRLVKGTRNSGGWRCKPEHQKPSKAQLASGTVLKEKLMAITRVVDTVLFFEKKEGPLLQIADACAFGFRRYFAGLEFGEECIRAMLNTDLVREDWSGGMSQFTFYIEPGITHIPFHPKPGITVIALNSKPKTGL
jgi:hypothetical protein